MKTFFTVALIAVADALLVLAALLLVAGYPWLAAAVGVATLAGVGVAAWLSRNKPAPASAPRQWLVVDEPLPDELSDVERVMLGDPVDHHAAQMIRALNGRSAVLPEQHLIQPHRPRHRRDNR